MIPLFSETGMPLSRSLRADFGVGPFLSGKQATTYLEDRSWPEGTEFSHILEIPDSRLPDIESRPFDVEDFGTHPDKTNAELEKLTMGPLFHGQGIPFFLGDDAHDYITNRWNGDYQYFLFARDLKGNPGGTWKIPRALHDDFSWRINAAYKCCYAMSSYIKFLEPDSSKRKRNYEGKREKLRHKADQAKRHGKKFTVQEIVSAEAIENALSRHNLPITVEIALRDLFANIRKQLFFYERDYSRIDATYAAFERALNRTPSDGFDYEQVNAEYEALYHAEVDSYRRTHGGKCPPHVDKKLYDKVWNIWAAHATAHGCFPLSWREHRNANFPAYSMKGISNVLHRSKDHPANIYTFIERSPITKRLNKNGRLGILSRRVHPFDFEKKVKEIQKFYPYLDVFKSEMPFFARPASMEKDEGDEDDKVTRTTENVSHLVGNFLDLDIKDTVFAKATGKAWADMSEEEQKKVAHCVLTAFFGICRKYNIPFPSIEPVFSGGGFHVRWNYSRPIWRQGSRNWPLIRNARGKRVNAFDLWGESQYALCVLFKVCGADEKALDVTRVLRPVGTTNQKYGTKVDSTKCSEGKYEPRYYNAEEFMGTIAATPFVKGTIGAVDFMLAQCVRDLASGDVSHALADAVSRKAKPSAKDKPKAAKKAAPAKRGVTARKTETGKRMAKAISRAKIADMEEDVLELAAQRYCQYRKRKGVDKSLKHHRIAKDFRDWRTYYGDIIRCAEYESKNSDTGFVPQGNRNFIALYAFVVYANFVKDSPKLQALGVDGFMGHIYNKVRKDLFPFMGETWMECEFDSCIMPRGETRDGTPGRCAYANIREALPVYWETGVITDGKSRYRGWGLYRAGEYEERIANSPAAGLPADQKRYPMLGYTVPIERILSDCGFSDTLAFNAGCATLYSDSTRKHLLNKWNQSPAGIRYRKKREGTSNKVANLSERQKELAIKKRPVLVSLRTQLTAKIEDAAEDMGITAKTLRGHLTRYYESHRIVTPEENVARAGKRMKRFLASQGSEEERKECERLYKLEQAKEGTYELPRGYAAHMDAIQAILEDMAAIKAMENPDWGTDSEDIRMELYDPDAERRRGFARVEGVLPYDTAYLGLQVRAVYSPPPLQ